jgi:acyl carrier protein
MTISTRPESLNYLILHYIADALHVSPEELDPADEFTQLGMSSIQVLALLGHLEDMFDIEVAPEVIDKYPTSLALAEHLQSVMENQGSIG